MMPVVVRCRAGAATVDGGSGEAERDELAEEEDEPEDEPEGIMMDDATDEKTWSQTGRSATRGELISSSSRQPTEASAKRTRKGVVALLAHAVEVVLDADGERAREVALLDGVALALPTLAREVGVGVEDHVLG